MLGLIVICAVLVVGLALVIYGTLSMQPKFTRVEGVGIVMVQQR